MNFNWISCICMLFFFSLTFSVKSESNKQLTLVVKKADNYIKKLILIENKQLNDTIHFAYPNRLIYYYINQRICNKNRLNFILPKKYHPFYDDDKDIMPFYNKLVFKKNAIDTVKILSYISSHKEIEQLLMFAMYADIIDINTQEIDSTMIKYSYPMSNIRGVAHCALASKWMIDLGMNSKINNVDSLLNKYISASLFYLNNQSSATDNGMEALLTLILLDKINLIKEEWIQQILQHQQLDGGWKWNESMKQTDQHPTLLAYWILNAWKFKKLHSNPKWFK